jgi:hypothetical protein
MSCPICSNVELNEGSESCPKCGSDLEIFTHIESAHKENAFQRKSILVLITLFGTVLVSWGSVSFFSGNKSEISESVACVDSTSVAVPVQDSNALTASSTPVEAFVIGNEEAKPEVAPLKAEAEATAPAVSTVAKTPAVKEKAKVKATAVSSNEGGLIIHTVKRGDSFWTISKKYFRNGNHAKKIAADNNLNPKKSIPLGTKLKINK